MRSERIIGFVLKRVSFGEADKIITLFSSTKGKIKVLAKGIRRIKSRRAPHLELFNLVEIQIHHGRTFDIVTEAKSVWGFPALFARRGLANLEIAGYLFYISEVLDKILPEHQPHEEIWSLLLQVLRTKKVTEDKVKTFMVQLLWNLGYLPRGEYPKIGVTSTIEEIIERPIRSKKFLEEI